MEKKRVSYTDFVTQLNSDSQKIEFENCFFESELRLGVPQTFEVKKEVIFKQCDFKGLEFVRCNFQKRVYFHACTFVENFSITVCNFNSQFITTHLKANRIAIWNNNFLEGFDFIRYKSVDTVTFQFNQIIGRAHIEQERENDPILIKSTNIQFENIENASISIEDIKTKEIQILFPNKKLQQGVSISGIEAENFEVLYLRNSSTSKSTIERIKANKITFLGLSNDGILVIKELESRRNLNENYFSIQDSYLGNCELYHVDLSSFNKIKIFNCHLQNIIPVNVKWNFSIKAYGGIKDEYLRDFFRQLKNVCSNNMDKIGQLRFEKLEMYYYDRQLSWKRNFGDWIIFKSNKYSNDYGQNWAIPIFWLIGFSFLFYTLLNYFFGNFECYHIGNYINFMMPFHGLKDVLCSQEKSITNNWVVFWDVVQRLFSGYFIFQFLRAFRKYVN